LSTSESDPALDALALTARGARCVEPSGNKGVLRRRSLVVPRNTVVEFPNYDRFDHNVFSRSKAAPAFDLDRYPVRLIEVAASSRSSASCRCSATFHPSHAGDHLRDAEPVLSPPADVPPAHFDDQRPAAGRYVLVAWQERCEEQRKPIDRVNDGDRAPVELLVYDLGTSRRASWPMTRPRSAPATASERGLGIKRERLDLPVVQEVHSAPPAAATAAPDTVDMGCATDSAALVLTWHRRLAHGLRYAATLAGTAGQYKQERGDLLASQDRRFACACADSTGVPIERRGVPRPMGEPPMPRRTCPRTR